MALVGAVAVIATGSNSFAEEKKAKKGAQKDQEKGKQPPAQQAEPQLIFSPWTKFCPPAQDAKAKPVCFIGKEARVETGQPVVAAVLIEPQGEPRKILRITLPLGMSLQQGTRAIVDQGQPMTAPYVICFPSGCMADYEASQALIDMLKKGKGLAIQGINGAGQAISLVLPLNDFAKAYDGPSTDPKEIERRNEELRKKFEQKK
jgi:invasion protein IalB